MFFEGAFIRGGAFILKSEILGGRLFEVAFIRGGQFIRGNTVYFFNLNPVWDSDRNQPLLF